MSQLLQPRRMRRTFDWTLFAIVGALIAVGMLSLYSASVADGAQHYIRQGLWYMIGLAAAGFVASQDYRVVARLAYPFMAACVALLVLVALVGTSINGSQRWLAVGDFSVQPSEFVKLAVILTTARYFSEHEEPRGRTLRDLLAPAGIVFIPFVLILAQPDLGTSLTLWLVFGTMTVFDRLRPRTTAMLIITVLVSVPLMWSFVMKDYQKDRVRAFLDPTAELQGDAWQVRQSRIAIGSGRLTGKGWLEGTQTQGGFVPYDESDFIFSHTGEQFGFVGGLTVLGLYAALLLWALSIARRARDRFGVLTAVGIAAYFFWHIAINLAMNFGWLPVVGLWLPFFSRGGTAVVTIMLCVGLLLSISMRRSQFSTR